MNTNILTLNVFAIILLIGIIKFFIGVNIPLQSDEAYWWALSRQLDFSYFDQGPMTPFHIWVFTYLFGDTIVALKLAAVSLTSIANFLIYLMGATQTRRKLCCISCFG
ncbi:MAG: hypothetical protein IPL26_20670 [Leptospiraceae bacterium]|nr:hypothetical protein [Leptospiraceae bacterium]